MKSKFVGELEKILGSVKHKAKIGVLLVGVAIASFNNISIANNFNKGTLIIENKVNDPNFMCDPHYTKHFSQGTETYDVYDLESCCYPPYGKIAKIVSIIPKNINDPNLFYELIIDTRPIESLTPVNLELSLYDIGAQQGTPVNVSNLENELWCSFPVAEETFGNKPITLWERSIIDPNKSPNDSNNYTLSFMADIKEAINKSNFFPDRIQTAKIPLDTLDGIQGSEIAYMYAQTNFKIFSGDFNLDGKVNLKDYAHWANCNLIADITGPKGLPDEEVNFHDFQIFNRDYLRDSNDPNTW